MESVPDSYWLIFLTTRIPGLMLAWPWHSIALLSAGRKMGTECVALQMKTKSLLDPCALGCLHRRLRGSCEMKTNEQEVA